MARLKSENQERIKMSHEDPTTRLIINSKGQGRFVEKQKVTHFRSDELSHIMTNYYKEQNNALNDVAQRQRKAMHLMDMKYDGLKSYATSIHNDYTLIFRVLREVFEDNIHLRDAYADIVTFDGLPPSWVENDEDLPDEPLRVRRRLNFANV